MSRRLLYVLIGVVLLIIIAGMAFRQVNQRMENPDIRATQDASVTDCADLYPAGSAAYKACIEGQ